MSHWDQVYRHLPPDSRAAVNDLVNTLFRSQTGVAGKIDPHEQPELAAKWKEIRDQVLANGEKFAGWIEGAKSSLAEMAEAIPIFRALDSTPEWIRTARGEIGQHEIAGKTHNPRIMEYIWTCKNIQEKPKQIEFVKREGEEGVDWCSAFVNWCLKQAGIQGTDHALAASWAKWGDKLDGPRRGAIVCFSWKNNGHIDHVAFCDEVDGGYRCLGGNQSGFGGQVSSVAFKKHAAVHYRWPTGH